MPLGAPVVPDDQSTHSGSSNAVSAYSSGASVPTASVQPTVCTGRSQSAGTVRLSTVSTVRTEGRPATSSATGRPAVVRLAAEPVAVGGDEHDRLGLVEAGEHAGGAEVRRRDRPQRTDGGGGEQRDGGFGDVGQVAGDPVAGTDAEPAQRRGHRGDLPAQLAVGHLDRAVEPGLALADEHQRGVVVGTSGQAALGEVEPRAGEPDRAGHPVVGQHRVVRGHRVEAEVVPDAGPEAVEVVDAPLPQLVVRVEAAAGALLEPAQVAGDLRPLEALRVGTHSGSLMPSLLPRAPAPDAAPAGEPAAPERWRSGAAWVVRCRLRGGRGPVRRPARSRPVRSGPVARSGPGARRRSRPSPELLPRAPLRPPPAPRPRGPRCQTGRPAVAPGRKNTTTRPITMIAAPIRNTMSSSRRSRP